LAENKYEYKYLQKSQQQQKYQQASIVLQDDMIVSRTHPERQYSTARSLYFYNCIATMVLKIS